MGKTLANPFYFGGRITNPAQFVGRADELRAICSRMTGPQMQSVDVHGEWRIGKSSLLYRVYQTYAQRVQDPGRFLVGYVSLQDVRVQTRAGLVQTVGVELGRVLGAHPRRRGLPAWPRDCSDLIGLRQALRAMAEAGMRCVLCVDEFEVLTEKPEEFDDPFYDGLRAMMEDQLIMLIVASQEPLIAYGRRFRWVSRFFNIGYHLELGEFEDGEARQLVALPSDLANGAPALGVRDQQLAIELAGRRPFLLQMAAHFVWEAQVSGRGEAWARKAYERQASLHRRALRKLWRGVLRATWGAPAWLGRAAYWVGERWDKAQKVVAGILTIAIIAVVLLVLFRVPAAKEILDRLLRALGSRGG